MTICSSSAARALAAAFLALGACADRAPIADTAAPFSARTIDFVVPTTIDLGAAPNAVVAADLDGDGKPDIAAATGANGIAVALSRSGGFAPPRTYAAGNAWGLVAGDFDGDGKVDLATMNENGVGVLLGNGNGSFAAPRSFAVGRAPVAIVTGDFDRDDKLGLAVQDGDGHVSVLLGYGDGTFQRAEPYASIPGARWLLRGDLDGDGKLDLLVVHADGRTVPLFGKGDGTFRIAPVSRLGTEWPLRSVAAGDLDGDGKLDLVRTVRGSGWAAVAIALGNGDGTFGREALFFEDERLAPTTVAVGELDGDGKIDFVAGIDHDRFLVAALGNGDGTFGRIAYYRSAGALLAVTDADGDGRADVLEASGNAVAMSTSNVDGTLRAPRVFPVGDRSGWAQRIAVGDFNRDGIGDIAVTSYGPGVGIAHIDVLLGDGRGGMRRAWSYGSEDLSWGAEIAAVDVDCDGVLDLVSAHYLTVLLGNGDGTFRRPRLNGHLVANGVALGDFDDDGKLDAALYLTGRSGLTIVPGKGDGTFAKERQTAVALDGVVTAVAAADLDGDGRIDLAVGTGGSLLVLLGKGDGGFAPARSVAGVSSATAVAAADLDGDGRLDLVVAHAGEDASTVLLNAGGGAFRVAGKVPSSGKLRIADMDGDGLPDVLVHGGVLVVYRGKGGGTFEAGRVYGVGGRDFTVGDVDGDGRPDVVTAMGGLSPFVSVLRNASR